jgi:hypothetical protein
VCPANRGQGASRPNPVGVIRAATRNTVADARLPSRRPVPVGRTAPGHRNRQPERSASPKYRGTATGLGRRLIRIAARERIAHRSPAGYRHALNRAAVRAVGRPPPARCRDNFIGPPRGDEGRWLVARSGDDFVGLCKGGGCEESDKRDNEKVEHVGLRQIGPMKGPLRILRALSRNNRPGGRGSQPAWAWSVGST